MARSSSRSTPTACAWTRSGAPRSTPSPRRLPTTEAAQLASQENKADILTGADLSQHDAVVATILIDLAQRDTNNKSIAFADIMADELAQVTQLVHKHRRFAGFAVLKSPDIPSVLLELGYLSNPDDARNLAQPDYRAKLGQAIVRSLDRYFAASRS